MVQHDTGTTTVSTGHKFEIVGADVPGETLFRGDLLVASLSQTPRTVNSVYYYDKAIWADLEAIWFQ